MFTIPNVVFYWATWCPVQPGFIRFRRGWVKVLLRPGQARVARFDSPKGILNNTCMIIRKVCQWIIYLLSFDQIIPLIYCLNYPCQYLLFFVDHAHIFYYWKFYFDNMNNCPQKNEIYLCICNSHFPHANITGVLDLEVL